MHTVIFEVWPRAGCRDTYLDLAASLRAELEQIEGFVSVERFESLSEPGKLLSLSVWRDEAAIRRWYEHRQHREAQAEGRSRLFADFRIRVAEVVRDYTLAERTKG